MRNGISLSHDWFEFLTVSFPGTFQKLKQRFSLFFGQLGSWSRRGALIYLHTTKSFASFLSRTQKKSNTQDAFSLRPLQALCEHLWLGWIVFRRLSGSNTCNGEPYCLGIPVTGRRFSDKASSSFFIDTERSRHEMTAEGNQKERRED
jgi:hypothetical protein